MKIRKGKPRYLLPEDCDPDGEMRFTVSTSHGIERVVLRVSCGFWLDTVKRGDEPKRASPAIFSIWRVDNIPYLYVHPIPDRDYDARLDYTPHIKTF